MSTESQWIALSDLPVTPTSCLNVIPINRSQYIVIESRANNSSYLVYDALKDEFSKPIKYKVPSIQTSRVSFLLYIIEAANYYICTIQRKAQ